jgi:Protein of unknown function (DUF2585)
MRQSFSTKVCLLLIAGIIIASAMVLHSVMGQPLICKCGYVKLWHGDVLSSENSQHISDWYSPSHVVHGILFYGALSIALPMLTVAQRAVIAILVEQAWEIFENTDLVIDRYREVTISLGYSGDSVINSAGDVLFMILGFWLASRLPILATIVVAICLELAAGIAIRDNLTLNVLMLIHPFEAIRTWQMAN